MVLGMSWAKPRSMGFSAQTPESMIIDPQWVASRGRFVMQATVDVAGGFPGYARHGARLVGADLRLYQRAIVIDEGTAGGFALAIEAVIGIDTDPLGNRAAPTVRVRYLDDKVSRMFSLTVRPSRPSRRTGRSDASLHEILASLGFDARPVDAISTARYHVPFDDADRFSDERVVWNGYASAPIQLGGAPDRVEIWVTDRSLVWANDRSGAVDRVPLEEVRDAAPGTTGSRGQIAVAYVGVGLGPHDRVEVPFIFDALASSPDNANARSQFVGALFSRGIATVQINVPWQPWRVVALRPSTGAVAHWPEHVTPVGVSAALDEALRQPAAPVAATPAQASARQSSSAADRLRPDRGFVIHGSDRYGYVYRADDRGSAQPTAPTSAPAISSPNDDRTATFDDLEPAHDELALDLAADPGVTVATETRPVPAFAGDVDDDLETPSAPIAWASPEPEPLMGAAERFERVCIGAINAAIDVISARRGGDFTTVPTAKPASDAERAAALADVIEDMASGAITAASAVIRKKRLEALADAAVRLHRLLDDHATGRATIEHIVTERIRISSGLTRVVAEG